MNTKNGIKPIGILALAALFATPLAGQDFPGTERQGDYSVTGEHDRTNLTGMENVGTGRDVGDPDPAGEYAAPGDLTVTAPGSGQSARIRNFYFTEVDIPPSGDLTDARAELMIDLRSLVGKNEAATRAFFRPDFFDTRAVPLVKATVENPVAVDNEENTYEATAEVDLFGRRTDVPVRFEVLDRDPLRVRANVRMRRTDFNAAGAMPARESADEEGRDRASEETQSQRAEPSQILAYGVSGTTRPGAEESAGDMTTPAPRQDPAPPQPSEGVPDYNLPGAVVYEDADENLGTYASPKTYKKNLQDDRGKFGVRRTLAKREKVNDNPLNDVDSQLQELNETDDLPLASAGNKSISTSHNINTSEGSMSADTMLFKETSNTYSNALAESREVDNVQRREDPLTSDREGFPRGSSDNFTSLEDYYASIRSSDEPVDLTMEAAVVEEDKLVNYYEDLYYQRLRNFEAIPESQETPHGPDVHEPDPYDYVYPIGTYPNYGGYYSGYPSYVGTQAYYGGGYYASPTYGYYSPGYYGNYGYAYRNPYGIRTTGRYADNYYYHGAYGEGRVDLNPGPVEPSSRGEMEAAGAEYNPGGEIELYP
ncbi:MAG: hypothetical protein RLY93_08630 [Sumerlaeia bacterium]